MKKTLLAFVIVAVLLSCGKDKCISCIAESISGKIVNYSIECDKGANFITGYENGLRQYYKDHGDTVVVRCVVGN